MLIREFNTFIRMTELSHDDTRKLVDSLDHYDKEKEVQVYRAVSEVKKKPSLYLYDASKGESRKTKGPTSLFLEKASDYISEDWNTFQRDRSIIGTTAKYYASYWASSMSYDGGVYKVVPTIDECFISNGTDFNDDTSWNYLNEKMGVVGLSGRKTPNDIKRVLYYCVMQLHDDGDIKFPYINQYSVSIDVLLDYIDENFETFRTKEFDEDRQTAIYNTSSELKFFNTIKEYSSIKECISDITDPHKNGFRKMKYSDLTTDQMDNEVWFSCPCLFISTFRKK